MNTNRIQNQTPQQQSNLQELDQTFNQMHPNINQFQSTTVPRQRSLPNMNSNSKFPPQGISNQSNNLILSSLEQQYFTDFLESFLGDTDTEANFMNNNLLQNHSSFNNMNNELSMKEPLFHLHNSNSNICYPVVNNISVPSNNPNSTRNNTPNPNILPSTEPPSSQPLNIIKSVNQNSLPSPNEIMEGKINILIFNL